MVANLVSDIYANITATARAVPTCGSGQSDLGNPAETNCTTTTLDSSMENGAWYMANWTNPAAWLVIVYCVASACTLLLLMCHGYLDGHLNLDFSHAAAAQRELRRRRRNSQRMEDWIEMERRQAEEVDTDLGEEEGPQARLEWPTLHQRDSYSDDEQPPTLYAGLDSLQREVMYERQERDARVLRRLERAGLL